MRRRRQLDDQLAKRGIVRSDRQAEPFQQIGAVDADREGTLLDLHRHRQAIDHGVEVKEVGVGIEHRHREIFSSDGAVISGSGKSDQRGHVLVGAVMEWVAHADFGHRHEQTSDRISMASLRDSTRPPAARFAEESLARAGPAIAPKHTMAAPTARTSSRSRHSIPPRSHHTSHSC